MTDKTAAVLKDKVSDVPQKTEPADHIVKSQNGQEALKILKGADKAKTTENLNQLDIVEKVKVEVKQGDTLTHIVEAHTPKKAGESHGDYVKRLAKTVDEVAKENAIGDPGKIKAGQKLELSAPPRSGEKNPDNKSQPEIKSQTESRTGQPQTDRANPVTAVDGNRITAVPAELVPEKKPVDVEAMKKQADDLYAVTAGRWGRDADRAKEILKNLDQGQRQVLEQQYKGRHGTTIDEMLRSELSGKDLTEAQTSLHAKDNQVGAERGKAERAAEAIDNAANGGLTGAGTDKKIIEEILKGKSKEELTAIDAAYKARTGLTLKEEMEDELSGSDLTRMLALTEGKNDDASRITAALEEHKEWGFGTRSNANVEKDLRDTISTLNSQQIADLDKAYRERNNGKSVSEAFQQDNNLPKETKEALAIYLKGTDKLTPADTLALAEIGLKAKNQDIFQEAFRGASPEARAQFLAQGGEQKVTEAFGDVYSDEVGNTSYSRNSDVDGAMDYVKKGKLDASTKIADNTGVFGDNEDAIELSLAQMTAAERKSYADGKALSASAGDTTNLSAVDKENLEYYNKVHGALDKAGDEREMAKWEDMIASGREGSLITKLAAHGGMFDDSMDKYLSTIEGMSKSDWELLKKDPEYRKKLESTLAIDLSDSEMVQARAALDKKMSADTFEGSKEKQRSVIDSIKDKSGFWNDDEKGIIGALERMTPEEQRRYREDPEFRKQLEQAVTSMDSMAEKNAVNAILGNVAKGEKPDSSIVSKLEMHSTAFNIDEAKVIADVEQAFRADPTLRERIKNPQTPADQEMAGKFDTALRKNLTPYEYEKFAKPLIENGRIALEVKADLYKGLFNDDEAGFYDSLKKDRATAEDWKEVLDNPDKVMGFLSKEEREVALNIARQQGEVKPEDNLRAAMLGAGTAEEKIKEVLGSMSPEQKQTLRAAYELKYGSSLTGDVLVELGGSDKVEAARNLRENQSARQAYNDARSEVSDSADGIGRTVVRAWDGTSQMTQDQVEQYSKAMGEYSKTYQEMPAENRQQFEQDVYKALELYKKSEMAAADTIIDGAIIAAGVGGAAFTGGVSLSLLAATSAGGALFKVGAKSAIMGADYDFNSAQIVSDGATGAIDAATIFLGPAQAALMLKMGERSAVSAVRGVVSQADNVAVATGKQLLKEGAEETLEKGLKQQMANAIANGAEGVDAKALQKLAEKVATNVDDVPAIQKLLTENLQQAIKAEATQGLKKNLTQLSLNTGAGAVGGMLSGGVRGGVDGESIDAVLAQSMSGLASGAAMAGTFTVAFKGLGKGISQMRQGDGSAPHINADQQVRLPGEVSPTPKLDANGRVVEYSTPIGKVEFDYHKSGSLEGEVKKVSLPNGIEYSSKDGANWTVKDPTAEGGRYEVKGTMKVDSDGTMHWQAEGGSKSQLRIDGSRAVEVNQVNGREVSPVDGRPVEFQEKVRDKFKNIDRETREQSVALVSRELGDVRAIGADGQPTSAYDSLMKDPTLNDTQKANILENLSDIREHFASYRTGDRMHSDPEVNWIHTQGELAKVLEVSRKAGLRADEMEDALLASMYSDSVKFAFPAPKGADPNFFTHHLDGALAAHEVLTRKGFPPERVDRIVQAIKEHQIAPPEFMGNLYLNAKIKPGLDGQLKSGAITAERHAELTQVLKEMTVVGPDNVPRLKPIAQVNDWPKVRNADGSWEVALTPDQRELFKLAGVDRWATPVNPLETPGFKQLSRIEQEKLVSQYKISTALINGDAVDNYATLGGASKIVTIRGPETNFKDGNVWQSIDSIDASYKDAYQVLTPEGKQLADASLAQRNALLNDAQGIKAKMNEWLAARKPPIDEKDVVYLQKDGKLKYPDALIAGELDRFNKLLAEPGLNAKTPEGAILRQELNALKYKGMTAEEIRQYDLAKEVRSQMADLMRAGHRVDDSLPGNFPEAKVEVERVAAQAESNKVIAVDKKNYLGEGDEGKVYSNGDGTVTKVYFDAATSVEAIKAIYTRLDLLGVRVPKIREVGRSPDGLPAIKMDQVGDGDHLQFQLLSRQLSAADMTALRQQYYAFGDAITNAGIRIDWQLKNMRFEDGKLYILDPSFLKEQPLAPSTVDRYGSAIGPRP